MRHIKTAFALVLVGLVTACSTSEPELPPPPPGSVVTSVSASSRDRDINGLPARGQAIEANSAIDCSTPEASTSEQCQAQPDATDG